MARVAIRSFLARLSPKRSIGFYLGDGEVATSVVAATPLGPVEVARESVRYDGKQLELALAESITRVVGNQARRRSPVSLSLTTLRVFFSTRPLKSLHVDASPEVLLHEVLRSSSIAVEDLAIDMLQANPDQRPVVSLAACRKRFLSGLLTTLGENKVVPLRVEPSPSALLRVAAQWYPAPRKTNTILRIFLSESETMATLVARNWPLLWRTTQIDAGGVGSLLLSTIRTFQTLGRLCGVNSTLETVMVHGRPDAQQTVDVAHLESQTGVKILWRDGPEWNAANVALGSALGGLQVAARSFDLSRSVKPRESLWAIFPWSEAIFELALVACLALVMMGRASSVQDSYRQVRSEIAKRTWMKDVTEQQLAKQKQELEQRTQAVTGFVGTRVVWTAYTQDLRERIPDHTNLAALEGLAEMEKRARKDGAQLKPKRSLTLRLSAPVGENGSVPRQIDDFLAALRGHPLLKRDFPNVELSDIKWFQPSSGERPMASFNVVCLPKASSAPAAPKKEQEEH